MGSSLRAATVSSVIAIALHGPFVMLLQQDRADEALDLLFVGKMPTISVRRLRGSAARRRTSPLRGGLQPLVRVGDDELDASQSPSA